MAQEEHYVSILNFSWPQVACVTECPVRGSRVVFVSFCDRSKQACFLAIPNAILTNDVVVVVIFSYGMCLHIKLTKLYIPLIFLQIQKFAVRFPHLGDAESFLNSVKVQYSIFLLSSDVIQAWLK
jgi:hypothetical protein